MNRTVCWSLAVVFAAAAVRMGSAQTAGMRPEAAHNDTAGPRANLNPDNSTPAPGIIPVGSPLTFGGANAPDTYSATTTFGTTGVLVDNGAVKIRQEQVSTGADGEWDVFYMQTSNGGPVAGNINANWNIVMNYVVSAPAIFDAVAQQWTMNGVAVSPLTNGIGTICCAVLTNPILPGPSYYNSGFSGPVPAGTFMNWQQVFVNPYNFVTAGGINPNTANGFTFALHFTLQPPMPVVKAAISASAYGGFPTFAPGSWIEIYGTGLASGTQTWASSDFFGVLGPTALGGTTVTIGGQPAFIDYVSPGQVNVQVPGTVGTGSRPLIVTTAAGASQPFTVTVNATQPGLLAPSNFNIGGVQYAAALFSDGSFVLPPGAISGITSRRAQPGDTILLYGVGFGSVNTGIPPGQLVQQLNTLAAPLTVSFGTAQATVTYDGLAPNFMGLYQFNVAVPSVPASDSVPVTFSLGGVAGTQKLSLAVAN